jgi:hypothetical protein
VPWVETESLSFAARHEAEDGEAATAILDELEDFRGELGDRFEHVPGQVTVIIHSHPVLLGFAHPWLGIAWAASAPAGRRYFAGWYSSKEIHVLSPAALERRASKVPGSAEALELTPLHEYAHVVVGANNRTLPPPFAVRGLRRYLRFAWLTEGAATHFAGQTGHLRGAIARRLREGDPPAFPPAARDAPLLGGTVFSLLAEEQDERACVALATSSAVGSDAAAAGAVVERAFGRPAATVARDWRAYLGRFSSS